MVATGAPQRSCSPIRCSIPDRGPCVLELRRRVGLGRLCHTRLVPNLESAVPPHEPSEDALAFAGKTALNAIPIVGPMAAEALAHALDSRQAARRHEFDLLLARSLQDVLDQLDGALTIETVVNSDEFVAAVARAQRAAAETAGESKRRRLARAAVNDGSWAPFTRSERHQFVRLVRDFDDLHVFLLQYFTDPTAWLSTHGHQEVMAGIFMAGVQTPFAAIFELPQAEWSGPVEQAVKDLKAAGLADIPLTTMMSTDGILASRTNEKGRRFLSFIAASNLAEAKPPQQL